RSFLKTTAAAALAPMIIPGSALGLNGAVAASNRLTMGLIGCGGHGTGWNLDRMFSDPRQQVVAVCDVDRKHAAEAEKRVNQHYSETLGGDYKGCDVHRDFRELINRKEIDAIDNATPDHWHVPIALMSILAGKPTICEKPLTLTIEEGRILSDAVSKSGVTFQTASENRSIDTYIQCVELVRAGYIGELRHIDVTLPVGNSTRGREESDFEEQPVPEDFDYEMWQGQAPDLPYIPARTHNTFRWNLAYSGGVLTDWGAHLIDLAQWANNTEKSGPVKVRGNGHFPPRDEVWNTTATFSIDYMYENGVTMNVSAMQPGIRFCGSEGCIGFTGWRKPLEASDPKILEIAIPEEEQLYRPKVIVARDSNDGGEHKNFVDCVFSGEECYAPAETGHRTTSISHIGNISMRLGGRELEWDPKTERFVGDGEADAMLSREQREPWTLKNVQSWLNVG
ncbi:MAG: Gfo/Idh/MocA family oxidoreductase, partial [Candidatus Omnitrophica bacterium]|nr:Gfo/Idh/MocA family oxidoreductase [Candidatus Omnitrophota bacterium]